MFIPIGFGNFLRKFPVTILLLTLVIGAFSYWSFPKIEKFNNHFVTKEKALNEKRKLLIDDVTKNLQKKTTDFGEQLKETFITLSDLQNSPDEWSDKFKSSKFYPDFKKAYDDYRRELSEAYSEESIANPLKLTLVSLLHSTFLHADWSHLLGNLFFLLLIGVWIEQRLGQLHTLVLFLFGSFTGLTIEVLVNEANVIGASAGVFAIMGAFLALFYQTQMRFLFTILPPFFLKVTLPTLWTFPFLFLSSDFLALGSKSGVAHLAHVVGAVAGFGYGYYHRVKHNLRSDQLFIPEVKFEKYLAIAQTPKEVWKAFYTIMRWNSQNQTAVKVFLKKSKEMDFKPTPKQKRFLESSLLFTSCMILQYGSEDEIREWVNLLPESIEPEKVLKTAPLKQLLSLADSMAQKQRWAEAIFFYQACLKKKHSKQTAINIQMALLEIEKLTKENSDECSA